MTVLIQIHYISNDNRLYRKGSFPLRGKSKEAAALDFWKWIKREHPFEVVMEQVIVDGEDLTKQVKKLEQD